MYENVHSGFSPFFALSQLRSLRCAAVLRVELCSWAANKGLRVSGISFTLANLGMIV
jgi:hypothetical protein